MNFHAVWVCYGSTSCCSCIGTQNYAILFKKNEGLKVKYGWTYLEDETANGCTGLGVFHITSSLNIVFLQSLVSDAVVVVEATSLQIIHVFKIHFKYFFG
jgi:hypothetical protein|tara:strand:+ start:639 stop:938 length:300 start_codon:yes stop_codon:yes gene_type:complete